MVRNSIRLRSTVLYLNLFLVFICIASANTQPEEEIGVFTNGLDGWTYNGGWEFKGAKGRSIRVPDTGHKSNGALRLSAEFQAGGSYVAVTRPISPTPLGELKFWIKPEGIHAIDVRLTDTNEQTFQYQVRLKDGDEWQELTVSPKIDSAKSHWGGNNNGVWGGEAKAVWIMLSRNYCQNNTAGAFLIDDIYLVQPKP